MLQVFLDLICTEVGQQRLTEEGTVIRLDIYPYGGYGSYCICGRRAEFRSIPSSFTSSLKLTELDLNAICRRIC